MTVPLGAVPNEPGLPARVLANAWSGIPEPDGRLATNPRGWITRGQRKVVRLARPPAAPDPTDPTDPRVGWGLVLPARDDLAVADRAAAADAEEPLRRLLAHRGAGAKVLRYRDDYGPLALFEADGTAVPTSGAPEGTEAGALPRYLLLAGAPDVLPWSLQYTLSTVVAVGRLHLTGEPLDRHVTALLADEPPGAVRYGSPLVWAVDHGPADITALMRTTIAQPIFDRLAADGEMPHARFLDGNSSAVEGSVPGLLTELAARDPALVVTSSHGRTGPLDDAAVLRRDLGLPVDSMRATLEPAALLDAWQPGGAIWYAQACCSAGSERPSDYDGLLDPASDVAAILTAVAGLGPTMAPLPTALLGAERPLRAFIGHVEPTFDWTISFPWTTTPLTAGIRSAVYDGICAGKPVGYAMAQVWGAIGPLRQAHTKAVELYNAAPAQQDRGLTAALYTRLAAADRAGTVLLGDPAARLALPGA